MTTVLIISEYNPFHKGHEYQIKDIRNTFGEDTAIIALMSGNYTQRGEIAFADKYLRAECAVLGGVNLVLLLPFPFSMSSAEFFASAGVEIANKLSVVDYIAFGSENGNVSELVSVAKNMLSPEFTEKLNNAQNDEKNKTVGYPKLCERVYEDTFSEKLTEAFFSPNNILAIEYIKALIRTGSNIQPYTTKRLGAGYNTAEILDAEFQSASAIRAKLFENDFSALDFIPVSSISSITREYKSNNLPCEQEKLSAAVLSFFRLNTPTESTKIHDADGGLYNRLISHSYKATNISTLAKLASTKKYTTARIKRAIWYSLFGVTSSDVRTSPAYTQLLATDSVGQALLRTIKKTGNITVVTKPSSYDNLDEVGKRQKKLSDASDFIFELSKPQPSPADVSLKAKPYVKKEENPR